MSLEEIYKKIQTGEISQEQFNELIEGFFDDGKFSAACEYEASEMSRGTGGWNFSDSIVNVVKDMRDHGKL